MQDFSMVHGRFQPFHNEHLEYVLRALPYGRTCIIGITNPDPSELVVDETDDHRHEKEANPFTYFQRYEMICSALTIAGVALERIRIVPFHLFRSERWTSYLPTPGAVIQCVRLFSDWERKKVRRFEEYGFRIEVLDEQQEKRVTGTEVRNRIRTEGAWADLVPAGTRVVLERILSDAKRV